MPRPPPYKRKIWEYKTANIDLIFADLLAINWHDLFLNLNASEKCLLFTNLFLDIMLTKRISNKIITCNEKDAPWITPRLKTSIRRNSRVYRTWESRGIMIKCAKCKMQLINLYRKLN